MLACAADACPELDTTGGISNGHKWLVTKPYHSSGNCHSIIPPHGLQPQAPRDGWKVRASKRSPIDASEPGGSARRWRAEGSRLMAGISEGTHYEPNVPNEGTWVAIAPGTEEGVCSLRASRKLPTSLAGNRRSATMTPVKDPSRLGLPTSPALAKPLGGTWPRK